MLIPADILAAFVGAAFALAVVPGPDNIFVLTQSAVHGRKAGLTVTLGLATGLIVHTTAVAFGVALLVATSPIAFAALKFVGAGYLLFLAWKAFRASASPLTDGQAPQETVRRLYLRGFIMNVVNPKVTVFFLAFLPQFVDPARGDLVLQFYLLGALMIVVTLIVFGFVALAAGSLGEWLGSNPRAQVWLNRISGLVFVTLAANLALAER